MSENRNILIIVDGLKQGGLARVMIDLAGGFKDRGHRVGMLVLSPSIDYEFARPEWLRAYPEEEPFSGLRRVSHRQRLSAFIKLGIEAHEAECGHADLVIVAGEMALRCAASVDHPNMLFSSHSSQLQAPKYANWFGRFKYRIKIVRRGRRVRQLLSGKNVHTVSAGLAHELTAVLGVRPKSLTVIYNPFDIERIRQLSAQPTFESTKQERAFIIGIGEFNQRKSFDRLIGAFAQSRFKGDLVLVGQGEDEAKLRKLAQDIGVADRVVFVPFHENHYALLRKARLLVLTSRSEGFGNVLVEALAAGVPALSVDCPHGPRDILSPIDADALVPPDHLELLPERIDRLVAQPYRIEQSHLRRFDRDVVLDQYLSLIGRL